MDALKFGRYGENYQHSESKSVINHNFLTLPLTYCGGLGGRGQEGQLDCVYLIRKLLLQKTTWTGFSDPPHPTLNGYPYFS